MDANTLRLILIVVGVMLILALYLWERRRAADEEDHESADAVHWEGRSEPSLDGWDESSFGAATEASSGPAGFAEGRRSAYTEGHHGYAPARAAPPPPPEPDLDQPLIVQLSIVAPSGGDFDGAGIVRAASTCGLEPGEMDVFHCYLGDEQEQQTLFRVANLVKPGTFPFGGMEDFSTPGLVLFATLEGESEDLATVDEMVGTARCLAEELGGDIRDETRNPFTAEKEESLRARVLARMEARDAEADGP